MSWKIQKRMDVGTSNPIVARIIIGLSEVADFTTLAKETKNRLQENCHEIAEFLIHADKAAKPLIAEINSIVDDLNVKGVQTQADGRCINLPHTSKIENSRLFLKYAKQALSGIAHNFQIIFNKPYQGPHFHKIKTEFNTIFGQEDILTRLITEDEPWIKQLIELRNEDEHPNSGKPFFSDFDINRAANGYGITLPLFFNGTAINNILEVFNYNLLTFSEEATVLALEKYFMPNITLLEIPEKDRNPDIPKRYTFGLKTKPIG
jgi:hypothetical protein